MDACGHRAAKRGKSQDASVFGYVAPPSPTAPSRDVLRWTQRLDLSYGVTNPRRDLPNGFTVGEILNRYFPADAPVQAFTTGHSSGSRATNWEYIGRVCRRNNISLPPALIDGTCQEVPGAAVKLLEQLYEQLTKRSVERLPRPGVAKDRPDAKVAARGPTATVPLPPAAEADAAEESAATVGARPIAAPLPGAGAVQFGAAKIRSGGDAIDLRRRMQAAPAG